MDVGALLCVSSAVAVLMIGFMVWWW